MSDNDNAVSKPRTFAEKISLTIALLILAAVVGTVVFLWLTDEHTAARFELTHGQVRSEGEAFYLPVTVSNSGDATASQVTVEGNLQNADGEETASTTFDFVPGHSRVETVLIFSADPSAAVVRVVSYQEP